jgi:hypothetical protein
MVFEIRQEGNVGLDVGSSSDTGTTLTEFKAGYDFTPTTPRCTIAHTRILHLGIYDGVSKSLPFTNVALCDRDLIP